MDSESTWSSDWLQRIIQEPIDEERELAGWPVLPLMPDVRRTVRIMCIKLGITKKGVPGNACRLMERYLARHLKKFSPTLRNSQQRRQYRDYLAGRLCLLLVSCIQLAAKMFSSVSPISVEKVRDLLLDRDCNHTLKQIREAEFHVFKTLNFRLLLWSSLETAEFLAHYVNLKDENLLKALPLAIELTEFNQYFLELHMQSEDERPNSSQGSSAGQEPRGIMQNVHMCAGAVIAAANYMDVPCHDEAGILAEATRASRKYLNAVANYIHNHILSNEKYIPILKKRRIL